MFRPQRPPADDARRLLREAALGAPDAALDAWHAWKALDRPPLLDPASQWWFPLVWWNLKDAPLPNGDRDWLRGEYHAAWLRNQHHLAVAGAAIAALEAADIRTLLLKGAALALTAYERIGLRPFGDVDVLVPFDRAAAARDLLAAHGWTPTRDVASSGLALRHGLGYTNGRGVDLDLHWVSLADCGGDAASDDGFWRRAIPVTTHGVATRALSPADQLLHVAIHGQQWTKVPTGHWRADLLTVLRRAKDALEWDVVLEEARQRRLSAQMLAALETLEREHGAKLPHRPMQSLRELPTTWWENAERRAKASRPGLASLVVRSWGVRSRRMAGAEPDAGSHAGTFLDDLKALTGVERAWELVPEAAARTLGRGRPRRVRVTRTFDAWGRCIRFEAEPMARDFLGAVRRRLPRLPAADAAATPDRVYDLSRLGGEAAAARHYRVTVNGQPLPALGSLEEAVGAVITDLENFLVVTSTDRAFLHAGVIAWHGRAIVLPGESRSGKTTLVAALLRAGATYVSDEFAVVRPDGLVEPYARRLALREGHRQLFVKPGALGAATGAGPLAAGVVLFTSYKPGAVITPAPLTKADALLQLLPHCAGTRSRPAATMSTLRAMLSHGATVWTSPRGEADAAVGEIARLLTSSTQPVPERA